MKNNFQMAQQISDLQASHSNNPKVVADSASNAASAHNIADERAARNKYIEQASRLGVQHFIDRLAEEFKKIKELLHKDKEIGRDVVLSINGLTMDLLLAHIPEGKNSSNTAKVRSVLEEADCYLNWFILSSNEKAANKGNIDAQFKVARALEGLGGPVNLTRAAFLFEAAARAGHIQAQQEIARYYEQGIVLKKDVRMAAAWYERAARLGDQNSQSQWVLFLIRHPSLNNLELAAGWLKAISPSDRIDYAVDYTIASDRLKKLLSKAPPLKVIKPDITDKNAVSKLIAMTSLPNALLRERDKLLEHRRILSHKAFMLGFSVAYEVLPIAGERIAYSVQKVNDRYRFCLEHWDPYLLQKITLSKDISRSQAELNDIEPILLQVPGRENTLVEFNPKGILSVKILEGKTHIAFRVQSIVPLNKHMHAHVNANANMHMNMNMNAAPALDIIKVSEIRRQGKIHIQSDNGLPLHLSRIQSGENVGIEANQLHYKDDTFDVLGQLEIFFKKTQNITQPIYTPGGSRLNRF